MKLRLNRIAYPVTALGFGQRLALWVQGCDIGCPGCVSRDTWDSAQGELWDIDKLTKHSLELITTHSLGGLTITGGEPTNQGIALAEYIGELTAELAKKRDERFSQFDILLFSGRTYATACKRAATLMQLVDIAICGPYRQDRPSDRCLVASNNQRVVTRTALGRRLYSELAKRQSSKTTMQVHVGAGDISMIGLPASGELDRLEEALKARGIVMKGRSW